MLLFPIVFTVGYRNFIHASLLHKLQPFMISLIQKENGLLLDYFKSKFNDNRLAFDNHEFFLFTEYMSKEEFIEWYKSQTTYLFSDQDIKALDDQGIKLERELKEATAKEDLKKIFEWEMERQVNKLNK